MPLLTKREIEKKIKNLSFEEKRRYINKILSKERLLKSNTKDAIYSLLGDLYLNEAKEGFKKNSFRSYPFILSAIDKYAKAGEYLKAKSLVHKSFEDKYGIKRKIYGKEDSPKIEIISKGIINYQKDRRKNKLEKNVTGIISVVGLISGIFFISSNITGNVISNLSIKINSFIGMGLLIIGLIAGFFWMKNKNK